MKTRITFLIVVLVGTLLVTGIGLQSTTPAVAQGGGSTQPGVTALSGAHYRLVSLDAGGNILAGGGYMLLGPVAPELQGSGCCCTYLPCVLRQH